MHAGLLYQAGNGCAEVTTARGTREQEHLYEDMFENAIWGIFQSTANGRFLKANPALARIYGYDTPKELFAALTDIDRQLYVEPSRRSEFIAAMLKHGFIAGFESQVYRRDGSKIWISESCRQVRNACGDFLYFEGTVEEITGRKRAEHELVLAKDMAESAYRAKSTFLANMSHELRTPLNAVLGFAQLMEQTPYAALGAQRYASYVADILSSGQHLLSLINSLLDLSKIEAGHFRISEEEFELAEVFKTCQQLMSAQAAGRGVHFTVAFPAHPVVLYGDPIRLKQVLLNLLSNAVKFTLAGQRVLMLAAISSDGAAELQVADSGIGMRAEDIAMALEPFQQIDGALTRRYAGTGLGLSLAKSMTELHGGTLAIVSAPGEGTTVTVRLPASRVLQPRSENDTGRLAAD